MTDPSSNRVYLDSNVSIYAVEGNEEIAAPLRRLFDRLRTRPGCAVTSELTLAEVLAKADAASRSHYLGLMASSSIFELCPVSREILIDTASYRRTAGMPKLADAIHVVTAIRYGCQRILSGDLRMKLPEGICLIETDPNSISRLTRDLSS